MEEEKELEEGGQDNTPEPEKELETDTPEEEINKEEVAETPEA